MPVSPPRSSHPIPAVSCPVCGEANHCAPAKSGSFDTPCWCYEVKVPSSALAKVPDELQGKACLCRTCAEDE